ncbi:MAG: choice-of-anchor tandem repeat NxxGxxAF-containing protein [Planctomycetota bacterium]
MNRLIKPTKNVIAAGVTMFLWGGSITAQAQLAFETVVLTGDAAPGTGMGVTYNLFEFPVINEAGQIAFSGFFGGTGVDATNDSGIWVTDVVSGTPSLIAREGSAAPGTGSDVNFNSFNEILLNGAGQAVFRGGLDGTGVDASNDMGIWATDAVSGTPGLVVRKGDAAPGTETGVRFSSLNTPLFNGAGQAAFTAGLSDTGVNGSKGLGIWVTDAVSGTPGLVARSGDAAPGTGPGVSYTSSSSFRPVLNGAGQIAFRSGLTGTGVDTSNDSGIWITDAVSGTPGLVAREGDAAPGTGSGGGVSYSGFNNVVVNDAGQTAFRAGLAGAGVDTSNDSGIWVTDAVSGTPGLVAREGDAAPGVGPGVSPGVSFSGFFNPVLNGAGQAAFLGFLGGTGVDGTNDSGIWVTDAVTGTPSLIAREGDAAPGTDPGVSFSAFSNVILNGAGQTLIVADIVGTGVDPINETGIWATDLEGILRLVIRTGDLFDVDDDPMVEDMRQVVFASIFADTGNEDGRRSSFNDNGQLAFKATFTDGSEGIFVTTIPEPAAGLVLLSLAGLADVRRRTRS